MSGAGSAHGTIYKRIQLFLHEAFHCTPRGTRRIRQPVEPNVYQTGYLNVAKAALVPSCLVYFVQLRPPNAKISTASESTAHIFNSADNVKNDLVLGAAKSLSYVVRLDWGSRGVFKTRKYNRRKSGILIPTRKLVLTPVSVYIELRLPMKITLDAKAAAERAKGMGFAERCRIDAHIFIVTYNTPPPPPPRPLSLTIQQVSTLTKHRTRNYRRGKREILSTISRT